MTEAAASISDRLKAALAALARDDESGQAMVEFVLVFPVQLFFTLAVIQFAMIAHAYIVVGQAAFMGARAAAVSDAMGDPANPNDITPTDAATRIAARTVGTLTTGGGDVSYTAAGGTILNDTSQRGYNALVWTARGSSYGYSTNRQEEAYQILRVRADTYPNRGYVACEVKLDYILQIPVAGHLFATLGAASDSRAIARDGRALTSFRIQRVGFVATPWTMSPLP